MISSYFDVNWYWQDFIHEYAQREILCFRISVVKFKPSAVLHQVYWHKVTDDSEKLNIFRQAVNAQKSFEAPVNIYKST